MRGWCVRFIEDVEELVREYVRVGVLERFRDLGWGYIWRRGVSCKFLVGLFVFLVYLVGVFLVNFCWCWKL